MEDMKIDKGRNDVKGSNLHPREKYLFPFLTVFLR